MLRDLDKYTEAEKMHRETLRLMEPLLGKEHPSTLTSMNNLVGVLRDHGRYEEGKEMHRHTLHLSEIVI